MSDQNILIIGGLSAAIALRWAGDVAVAIEKDRSRSVDGVGIIPQSNVARPMAQPGVTSSTEGTFPFGEMINRAVWAQAWTPALEAHRTDPRPRQCAAKHARHAGLAGVAGGGRSTMPMRQRDCPFW